MSTSIDLNRIAGSIADLVKLNIDIDIEKTVDNRYSVTVRDLDDNSGVTLTFDMPGTDPVKHDKDIVDQQLFGKPVADVKPVASFPAKPKNSKWWSRYHFEANLMKMTWRSLHDEDPARVRFSQQEFVKKLARLMLWQESTAARHVQRAARLGLLNRSVIGRKYYIESVYTQVHDNALLHDSNHTPVTDYEDDDTPTGSALADEGRPLHELEIERAVNETLLP